MTISSRSRSPGFVAGQLYGNLGSFIQVTGDPRRTGTVALDASDIRYADTFKLFDKNAIWGIDANNTPTVEDPWNTTPSFGWPQISSTVAPDFAPPLTRIESGYTRTVGGAGAYLFWNDMLYADFTAYKGLSVPDLQALNDGNSTTDAVTNVAPYWRLALEPHWGSHYLMVGTFGMYGQIAPGRQYGIGTDNYLDVGFDSQYQYDGDPLLAHRQAHRHHRMAEALTRAMSCRTRRTSTIGSTASRPTRRSFGITPTAWASATSTSAAHTIAFSTAQAANPLCSPADQLRLVQQQL